MSALCNIPIERRGGSSPLTDTTYRHIKVLFITERGFFLFLIYCCGVSTMCISGSYHNVWRSYLVTIVAAENDHFVVTTVIRIVLM